jgi:hypothetical protein
MKLKNLFIITLITSSLLFSTTHSCKAVDVAITDDPGDVISLDFLTGEGTVVTDHPDIEVDNLDLIQGTYTQTGTQATVSLQVNGTIENRGEFPDDDFITDIDMVEYGFELITSGQGYSLGYCNETGRLYVDDQQINLTSSDFSVLGDTLTMTFQLASADEVFENLSVSSMYFKLNFSGFEPDIVILIDIAPNPPLWIDAYAPAIEYVGERIEFYGSVDFLSGHPPLTYSWDFGDGGSSTELEPTHIYTEAGVYTWTFTVTDTKGDSAQVSNNITIMDVKKAFLFGRFTYMDIEDDRMFFVADKLGMILFEPFQVLYYNHGAYILVLNEYKGMLISNKFLIGIFKVLVYPDQTPQIAYKTDTPSNSNTAKILFRRVLPQNVVNLLDCH